MFKKLIFLFILAGFSVQAQHSITGTLKNPDKESWIILYRVEGGEQLFVANTVINNGQFVFNIKRGAPSGIYRLLFRLDKKNALDFIYNDEDIVLSFDPKDTANTINFEKSKENNLFKEYTENIAVPQSQVDSLQLLSFQVNDAKKEAKIRKDYTVKLKAVRVLQNQFETKAKGMLVSHYIKAGARYNAALPYKDPSKYLAAIKAHFFDAVDFNNESLLKSTLITDRIIDYVFYVNTSSDKATQERLYKNSVNDVFDKISNKKLRKEIVYFLIKKFSAEENKALTVYMFDNYFNTLPQADQDLTFKESTLSKLKIVLNIKAPNITWQDFGGNKSLYGLKGSKYYLIVFWSSTCGHCLHEVPILYNYIKDKKDIKVVAVGLESGPNPWTKEMSKYPDFIHVFGKDKWRNQFARAYDIHATPTYIILDSNKRIVAKPYGEADVKAFFDKLKM